MAIHNTGFRRIQRIICGSAGQGLTQHPASHSLQENTIALRLPGYGVEFLQLCLTARNNPFAGLAVADMALVTIVIQQSKRSFQDVLPPR